MLNIKLDPKAILEAHILYGENALHEILMAIRYDIEDQIREMKKNGSYQKYAADLNIKLLKEITSG